MLVPEQTLSKGAVESFHYRLVPVNLLAPTENFWFVFFHLFDDSAHALTPRVHLQKLWPFQRPAFENVLKSARDFGRVFRGQGFSFFETAGHVDDGQSVLFVCFSAPATPHRVVLKKEKVCLVNNVWRRHIEFGARNVVWCRKIYLPKGLPYQPFCRSIL